MKNLSIKLSIFSLAILAGGLQTSNAQVLTFEGLQGGETVSNYYNGGTGGAGSTGGTNYGVSFSSNARALTGLRATGGHLHVNNYLSLPVFGAAMMNVPGGFSTGLAFDYSALTNTSVKIYGGLNGTGSLLASLNLTTLALPNLWTPIGVNFAGTAKSVSFGNAPRFAAYDNITLNSARVGTAAVPEPGNVALLIGMASVGGAFLRRRRK